MAGFVLYLLLLTIQCVVLDGTKRNMKLEYKPYGPKMCRQLCQDMPDIFFFMQESLACHRASATDSLNSVKMNYRRTDLTTAHHFQRGLNICNRHDADMNPSKTQPQLPTETTHTEELQLVKYKHTISLHQACEEGNLGLVKYILSQGLVDINCRGKMGRVPVMAAAVGGQLEVFDYLVGESCDLSVVDDKKDNVLHVACRGGSRYIVRELVEVHNFNVDSRDSLGRTPVMRAAWYGHDEVFDFLVEWDCNLRAVCDKNLNILHVACGSGDVYIVDYIVTNGIWDIDTKGFLGRTALMMAAEEGHKVIFDYLVANACNVTAVDDNMDNILHIACCGGHVDMVQYILSQNIVSVESRGFAGRTPLMLTAEKGCKEIVDVLVSIGGDLTAVDDDMNNILHLACFGGHVDMVKHLMTLTAVQGIEKATNQNGETPIQLAESEGHEAVVSLLNKGI